MNSSGKKKPKILVSSTVYGNEDLLDRIHAVLTAFGYEVEMSHKGTLFTRSDRTAFENCLAAVDGCDLFLGLITPQYGTGLDGTSISITHQELRRAIECKKPRWLLAHHDVAFARRFLRDLGYKTSNDRSKLTLVQKSKSLTDLRVIDMYEEATRDTLPLEERDGNWVQEFLGDEDALLYASSQFSRLQEVERFLEENLKDPASVLSATQVPRGDQP